ncbi:FAD-binding protein [Nocardioides guangzhouensis]|uniref:FAD-binding protein n=1 Tax=Nocardioides guangzhouensis TaxID=2497878 RepID=A0A4Q4ZI23_9ACTN|nr:D-arabinono-1,4-lactone oxidase [Nocardioides guangzhouensis]RYP87004.1 FAD-binding protein [Nocardioides guangzhouensis]
MSDTTPPGWRNWSRLEKARPARVVTPTDADEVGVIVREVAERGGTLKVTGTGHSFTPIAVPEDVLLRPEGLSGVVGIDREAMTATVRAGTPLHELNAELTRAGLSLHNMGDIDRQTVSGATSTGTHGTGGVAASLAMQLSALELVTGDGSVLRASRTENADVFAVARVGLGALGVLTELTFDVEPLGVLEAHERTMPWDEALASYDEILAANHHADLYWFPHTDVVQVKTNNRLDAEPSVAEPLGRVRRFVDDELLANGAFGVVNAVGNRAPRLVPPLARLSAGLLSERRYSDVPHRVFTAPRRVVFREMEYAVPREAGMAALREARALVEKEGWRISFPVEIRYAPADDIALSTASARDSVYLAFHVNRRTDHTAYFRGVERVMREHDGRPHWGKLHTRTAADLAPAYPRWDEFQAVRDRLDPRRVFVNAHLRTILGP